MSSWKEAPTKNVYQPIAKGRETDRYIQDKWTKGTIIPKKSDKITIIGLRKQSYILYKGSEIFLKPLLSLGALLL